MITSAEADTLLRANTPDFGNETVDLQHAVGRILREDINAERDQPPFDRVTMDGIAFAYENGRDSFRVQGRVLAGQSPPNLAEGCCVEIMTGAVLPPGADTVVPVEVIQIDNGRAKLSDPSNVKCGQFVHRRGSDHGSGALLLRSGLRLGGPEIAILASAGHANVQVARTPSVTIIATGDELVAAGQPLADHQIRLSNGPAMAAALREAGFSDVRELHVADTPAAITQTLSEALERSDVLILSGGVSMGKADFVPGALHELDCKRIFHRIRQRPGKPMWFGVSPRGQLVFALPGNPVSALVCHRRYVLPTLARAAGLRKDTALWLPLHEALEFSPDLTGFFPAVVERLDGISTVRAIATNTSGDFSALGGTDGLIELPQNQRHFAAGSAVRFIPWGL